jgi:hypothetical protein
MSALAALLVTLAGAQAMPQVVVVPQPEAEAIVFEAFVPGPEEQTEEAEATWRVLSGALVGNTSNFSRSRLIRFASQTGTAPVAVAYDDFVRIRFEVPPTGESLGAHLLEEMLWDPAFGEDELARGIRKATASESLRLPYRLEYDAVTLADLERMHQRLFAPANVTVFVGGRTQAEAISEEIFKRVPANWDVPPNVPGYRDLRLPAERPGQATWFEIRGEPIDARTVNGSAVALALFAFGVGKESTLFSEVREEARLAYDIRALLWPNQEGWLPRLILRRTPRPEDRELPIQVPEILRAAVENWSEDDLNRALALARESLRRETLYSPFWLTPQAPLSSASQDEYTWLGYHAMLGLRDVSRQRVLLALEEVTLEDMKFGGNLLLDEADIFVIPGS